MSSCPGARWGGVFRLGGGCLVCDNPPVMRSERMIRVSPGFLILSESLGLMESTPAPRPRRLWIRVLAGLVAVGVIGAATGVGLFRLAALTVPAYRREVQGWASRIIGVPLTIQNIEARWGELGPELVLDSVALGVPHRGTPLARARQIVIYLSIPVMVENGRLLPSGVTVHGLRLTVRRSVAGDWRLPWEGLKGSRRIPVATVLAVVAQDARLEFRDAVIRLVSDRGSPPTRIQVSRLRISVRADRYQVRLKARVSPRGIRTLDLEAHARGPRTNPGLWHWHIQGQVRDFEPGILPPLGLALPLRGFGRSQLSLVFEGSGRGRHPTRLHGSLAVTGFGRDPRGGALHTPSARIRTGFRVDWIRQQALLSPLIVARPGHPLRQEDLEIGWSGTHHGPAAYRLGSRQFFLGTLEAFLPLIRQFPMTHAVASVLGHVKPAGQVDGLASRFVVTKGSLDLRSASGRFLGVGGSAWGGWPGLAGLSGRIDWMGDQGSVIFTPSTVTLRDHRVFRRTISLAWGGTVLSYERHAGIRLSLTPTWIRAPGFSMRVRTADLDLPAGGSPTPTLHLDARLHDGDLPLMAQDIPYGILSPGLDRWLAKAFVAGTVPKAHLVLDGQLPGFPFSHGGGRFEVGFSLTKAEVHIAPGWPDLQVNQARGAFSGAGFSVEIASGMEAAFPLAGSRLVIPQLKRGVLHIQDAFAGQASTLVSYLDSSPLSRRWGGLFTRLELEGPLKARVGIRLPVHALAHPTIRGKVWFDRDRFRWQPLPLHLHHLKGSVRFDNLALITPAVTARLDGHHLTFNAWIERGETHLQMVGRLDVAKLGLPAPLSRLVQGASDWQAELSYPFAHLSGRLRFAAVSQLVGTRLLLPAPLGKVASQSMGLDFSGSLFRRDSRFRAQGNWGPIVWMGTRGRFIGGRPLLSASRIDFGGQPSPLPPSGILVTGHLGVADVAGWWRLDREFQHSGSGFPPLQVQDLRLAQLTGWGQNLGPLHLSVEVGRRTGLRFQVNGQAIAGTGFIPPHGSQDPIRLDFSRFEIAPLIHLSGSGTKHLRPDDLPNLDWSSAQTRYGRLTLGKVVFSWIHPDPHTLGFTHVAFTSPDLEVTGGGQWTWDHSGSRVALNARIVSPKLGSAFRQLGIKRILTGEHSRFALKLGWRGLPWHPNRSSLAGGIQFSVRDGRVLAIQPGGAGRFIALLSLNALPRRLGLDFSDVFARGLSYDRLQGSFTIRRGVAVTRDATLFGSSIAIWLTGETNLVKRSYDQVALVIPHVGSTLPIAGAIFGGPVGGGILLALSRIFRHVIESMSETYYHVTGPWKNPRIHQITAARAHVLGFVKKPG